MHTCILLHGLRTSWHSCPRRMNAGNKNTPSMHLCGWIKKKGRIHNNLVFRPTALASIYNSASGKFSLLSASSREAWFLDFCAQRMFICFGWGL